VRAAGDRGARAPGAGADAQIATLEKQLADTTFTLARWRHRDREARGRGRGDRAARPSRSSPTWTEAWAEVFVDAPVVPRLRHRAACAVHTDAGGDGHRWDGQLHLAARRVHAAQRADRRRALEARLPRARAVDNRDGVLKQGMPVEAELPLQPVTRPP
jgi:hypothetical protein